MSHAVSAPVQAALIDAAARFDDLLRSVRDPKARAIGHWTVEQTVAHMTIVSHFDALTCRGDVHIPPGTEELLTQVADARVADIADINARSLELFAERDLYRLGEQIATNIGVIAFAATAEPERIGSWLGGLPLAMKGVAAHYLGELIIHGFDIARSQGLEWDIKEREALLAYEACYMPVMQAGAEMMSSPDHKPVSVELRTPGTEPMMIDISPGRIAVGPPTSEPADITMTANAVSMTLMMFNRINPFVAVATGRVKVGGRRPWRVLRFRRQLQMP